MNSYIKSIPVGLIVAVTSAFSLTSAVAAEIPARGPIPFAAYDSDGNGLVSEEEFNTARGERMASRAAEGRPMRGAAGAPAFSAFDTNADGQLNPDELAAGQNAQRIQRHGTGMGQGRGMGKGMGRNMPSFSDCDLNGDGKIPEKEFDEARSKRISERARQGYQMKNLANAPSFADIDTDGNGEISTEEFAVHQSSHRRQKAQ